MKFSSNNFQIIKYKIKSLSKIYVLIIIAILLLETSFVKSDLPAHCLARNIEGRWIFHLGSNKGDKNITCGHRMPDKNLDHINGKNDRLKVEFSLEVVLERPNLVYNKEKTEVVGRWTMVYDEGFEFNIHEKLFFAFSKYRKVAFSSPSNKDNSDTPGYEFLCGQTFIGWYHDQRNNSNWGCYFGNKVDDSDYATTMNSDKTSLHNVVQQSEVSNNGNSFNSEDLSNSYTPNNEIFMELEAEYDVKTFEPDISFVEKINSSKSSLWKAKIHDEFIGKSYSFMRKILGLNSYNISTFKESIIDSSFLESEIKTKMNLEDKIKSTGRIQLISLNKSKEKSKFLNRMKLKFKNKVKNSIKQNVNSNYNSALLDNIIYSGNFNELENKEGNKGEKLIDNDDNDFYDYSFLNTNNEKKKVVNKNLFRSYSEGSSQNENSLTNISNKSSIGLPVNFDWRNISGVNYDSPVRKQGECGSCYAIAAISVLESRIRIKTNNKDKPILSVASAISCSRYNQGCEGGYPYLIGKHAREHGVVEESCHSYTEDDSVCKKECYNKKMYKVIDYGYVGDYYGATNEEAMMREVFNNGPIVVAINASPELYYYSGGIFTSNVKRTEGKLEKDVKPWEYTNHAVTCIGWGEENVNGNIEKFWILKNSWGQNWGDKGYFKLKRGMASSEAQAVYLTPEV